MGCSKTFWKSLRDHLGMMAAVYGSIPGAAVHASKMRETIEIPEIRTRIELPSSVEEAFRQDFEKLGGDLQRAVDKYARAHKLS